MRANPWADAGVACIAQWIRVADAVEALPDDAFALPTGLPGWRVSELVAHLVMCASSPARWLTEPTPDRAEATVADYLLCLRDAASSIDERTHSLAAGQSPARLKAAVRTAVDSLREVVAETDPARVIPTRLAPMRFDDFLVTRCVEGVVHGLDLVTCCRPRPGRFATLDASAPCGPGREGARARGRGQGAADRRRAVRRGSASHQGHAAERGRTRSTHLGAARGRPAAVDRRGRRRSSARQRRTKQHQRPAADPLAGASQPAVSLAGRFQVHPGLRSRF